MRIIICVTNDLSTDQRVHKVAQTLSEKLNHKVMVVGRKLPDSKNVTRKYNTFRLRIPINKGFLFYAFFNIQLLFFLLLSKFDTVLSNDLDTLAACSLSAKLKNKKLIYDSHELFTEVPELIERPKTQKIWAWIEKKYIKKVTEFYTVSEPIANYYAKKYNKPVKVIRNVPLFLNKSIDQKFDRPTLIYQGALNKGRGLELMIETMRFLPDYQLLICGSGYLQTELKQLIYNQKLQNINLVGHKDFNELRKLTAKSHIGLSWEEDVGKNYRYALPNKLFDYIQARIPVLISPLPAMNKIIDQYGVGDILESKKPEKIAVQINQLFNKRITFDRPLEKAASELCWEKEAHTLIEIFKEKIC